MPHVIPKNLAERQSSQEMPYQETIKKKEKKGRIMSLHKIEPLCGKEAIISKAGNCYQDTATNLVIQLLWKQFHKEKSNFPKKRKRKKE